MARSTIGAILSVVLILMASHALSGGGLIDAVPVTFLAFQICVFSYQWESRVIVIKGCILPARRAVACSTICAKLAAMRIV